MFKKAFSFGGLLGIAVAMVLLTVEPAQAAPPRGYHRGGYYGLYHGRHYGGYRGYYRPYYGGYHHHFYRPYYFPPYYGSFYYPYYGNSYYGYRNYEQPDYGSYPSAPAKPTLTVQEKDVRALLAATGVSAEEGRLAWPLGLRVLPGKETATLRAQIDALFQAAATQAARGRPNATLVQEVAQAADKLRKRLLKDRQERASLAVHTYEEAERFLDKLKDARKLLLVAQAPVQSGSGGEGQVGLRATRVELNVQVSGGVSNNQSREPRVTEVSARRVAGGAWGAGAPLALSPLSLSLGVRYE